LELVDCELVNFWMVGDISSSASGFKNRKGVELALIMHKLNIFELGLPGVGDPPRRAQRGGGGVSRVGEATKQKPRRWLAGLLLP